MRRASTWRLALRWLGLRDRKAFNAQPRSPLYWLLLFVGAVLGSVSGALAGHGRWWLFVAGVLLAGLCMGAAGAVRYARGQRPR
jgi:hypothetical protein